MAVGCYGLPPAVEGGERPHPCGPHTCCTCPHCNRTETAAPTPHAERPAYVMTLRDPAARFESRVLYALSEWRRGGPATTCTICSVNRFRWRSARAYLDVCDELQRLRGGDLAHAAAEGGERAVAHLRVVLRSRHTMSHEAFPWY